VAQPGPLNRDDPERRAQGVHRARQPYIVPPRPSLRAVADTSPYCRRELRGGTDAPYALSPWPRPAQPVAGDRVHAGQRQEYVAAGWLGLAVDTVARQALLFLRARNTSSRERREVSAARAVCGRAVMKEEFRRRTRVRRCCASTPRRPACSLRAAARGEPDPGRGACRRSPAELGGDPVEWHTNFSTSCASRCPAPRRPGWPSAPQQVIAKREATDRDRDPFAGSYAIGVA